MLSTVFLLAPARLGKNTTQLAKYPLVIHVKPSNKVYTFLAYFTLPGTAKNMSKEKINE